MPDSAESKIEILTRAITSRIADGTYAVGTAIPSGAELRDEFGVSQQTVRTVTLSLKERGILETRFGRGLFVTADAVGRVSRSGG